MNKIPPSNEVRDHHTKVRRHQLLQLAVALVQAEPFGPNMRPIVQRCRAYGIDITNNDHLRAMQVLMANVRYGMEPSPSALATLGCEA